MTNQRIVIGMFDGMGIEYFGAQPLMNMQRMATEGFFRQVSALMPSVTNLNNVSIRILDDLLGEAAAAAPDAAFLLTADHGMNAKKRCWDVSKAYASREVPLRFTLSVEKDRYVRHHRSFGGTAWLWLHSPDDTVRAIQAIMTLERVEQVLTREEAAKKFHLMPERIGELVVLGDHDTVFGELETEMEILDAGYRSHGSLYELAVPLIIFNQEALQLSSETLMFNADLTKNLYR